MQDGQERDPPALQSVHRTRARLPPAAQSNFTAATCHVLHPGRGPALASHRPSRLQAGHEGRLPREGRSPTLAATWRDEDVSCSRTLPACLSDVSGCQDPALKLFCVAAVDEQHSVLAARVPGQHDCQGQARRCPAQRSRVCHLPKHCSAVQVHGVVLGQNPPTLSGVKAYPQRQELGREAVTMEFDFVCAPHCKRMVLVSNMPGGGVGGGGCQACEGSRLLRPCPAAGGPPAWTCSSPCPSCPADCWPGLPQSKWACGMFLPSAECPLTDCAFVSPWSTQLASQVGRSFTCLHLELCDCHMVPHHAMATWGAGGRARPGGPRQAAHCAAAASGLNSCDRGGDSVLSGPPHILMCVHGAWLRAPSEPRLSSWWLQR